MNLQELLLHMDPGLAGVIVPTLLLIGLMVVPYVDRSNEGQGIWFGTANAVRITMFSLVYTGVWITWLILWDDGAHVRVYERLPMLWGSDTRLEWPGHQEIPDWMPAQGAVQAMWDFVFLENRVAIRDEWEWSMPVPFQPGEGPHDGSLDWPQDFQNVPLPFNGTWLFEWEDPEWLPGWLRRVYPYNTYLDIPEITVQYVIPIIAMIGLPIVLLVILNKLGWASSVRDYMVALFTGFILTYTALTIIGVAFRGKDQALVPFWKVPNLHHDPSIYREVPHPPQYGIIDTRSGTHA
jgi:hypothetical protein